MQVSSTKLSKGKRRPKELQEQRGTEKNKEKEKVKAARKGRKNPNSKPRKPIRILLHNPNRAQKSTPYMEGYICMKLQRKFCSNTLKVTQQKECNKKNMT
jgi:hypothetical protein